MTGNPPSLPPLKKGGSKCNHSESPSFVKVDFEKRDVLVFLCFSNPRHKA
jgi:hypothetical protein